MTSKSRKAPLTLASLAAVLIVTSLAAWAAHLKSTTPSTTVSTSMVPDPRLSPTAFQSRVVSQMTPADNAFGFDLFRHLERQNKPEENVFISPTSIALALAMTYNGATGETKAAMAKTLHLQGLSLEDVNRANAGLLFSLSKADPKVTLEIANSLWARKRVVFLEEFLHRNREFYGARVTSLNFASPDALPEINGWVDHATHGKISSILDRLGRDDVLVLLNAVYFKGSWTQPFEERATTPQPFTLPGGTSKMVPMMRHGGEFDYAQTDLFQAVRLPYGNGRLGMVLFLPKEGKNLSDLTGALSVSHWSDWTKRFQRKDGFVALPRFTLQYGVKLNDALKALGMEPAFTTLDFAGMSPQGGLAIGEARHKTYLRVDEEGTEASAATSVTMLRGGRRAGFQIVFNHPFLTAIVDRDTGAILFLGTVVNPAA